MTEGTGSRVLKEKRFYWLYKTRLNALVEIMKSYLGNVLKEEYILGKESARRDWKTMKRLVTQGVTEGVYIENQLQEEVEGATSEKPLKDVGTWEVIHTLAPSMILALYQTLKKLNKEEDKWHELFEKDVYTLKWMDTEDSINGARIGEVIMNLFLGNWKSGDVCLMELGYALAKEPRWKRHLTRMVEDKHPEMEEKWRIKERAVKIMERLVKIYEELGEQKRAFLIGYTHVHFKYVKEYIRYWYRCLK